MTTHFSARHYRLVSPAADTAEQIADRKRRARAATLAVAEREAAYPVLTAANAADAIAFQERRLHAWVRTLTDKDGTS
jgi:hypothetical protein